MESKTRRQLALSMTLRDDSTLDSFYPGNNSQALAHITQMAKGQGDSFIYLWGQLGVGRTHLLQGACHSAQKFGSAVYLPLENLAKRDPGQLFQGLEKLRLVCLDDIDALSGPQWEEAFFHLYNRIREAQSRLLVCALNPPQALNFKLPDLRSRLAWGVHYQIHPLDDEQLLKALQLRASGRGLELSEEVGIFLIRRTTRAMPDLYQLLERLDRASLEAQRRLTIPFVKSVLMI